MAAKKESISINPQIIEAKKALIESIQSYLLEKQILLLGESNAVFRPPIYATMNAIGKVESISELVEVVLQAPLKLSLRLANTLDEVMAKSSPLVAQELEPVKSASGEDEEKSKGKEEFLALEPQLARDPIWIGTHSIEQLNGRIDHLKQMITKNIQEELSPYVSYRFQNHDTLELESRKYLVPNKVKMFYEAVDVLQEKLTAYLKNHTMVALQALRTAFSDLEIKVREGGVEYADLLQPIESIAGSMQALSQAHGAISEYTVQKEEPKVFSFSEEGVCLREGDENPPLISPAQIHENYLFAANNMLRVLETNIQNKAPGYTSSNPFFSYPLEINGKVYKVPDPVFYGYWAVKDFHEIMQNAQPYCDLEVVLDSLSAIRRSVNWGLSNRMGLGYDKQAIEAFIKATQTTITDMIIRHIEIIKSCLKIRMENQKSSEEEKLLIKWALDEIEQYSKQEQKPENSVKFVVKILERVERDVKKPFFETESLENRYPSLGQELAGALNQEDVMVPDFVIKHMALRKVRDVFLSQMTNPESSEEDKFRAQYALDKLKACIPEKLREPALTKTVATFERAVLNLEQFVQKESSKEYPLYAMLLNDTRVENLSLIELNAEFKRALENENIVVGRFLQKTMAPIIKNYFRDKRDAITTVRPEEKILAECFLARLESYMAKKSLRLSDLKEIAKIFKQVNLDAGLHVQIEWLKAQYPLCAALLNGKTLVDLDDLRGLKNEKDYAEQENMTELSAFLNKHLNWFDINSYFAIKIAALVESTPADEQKFLIEYALAELSLCMQNPDSLDLDAVINRFEQVKQDVQKPFIQTDLLGKHYPLCAAFLNDEKVEAWNNLERLNEELELARKKNDSIIMRLVQEHKNLLEAALLRSLEPKSSSHASSSSSSAAPSPNSLALGIPLIGSGSPFHSPPTMKQAQGIRNIISDLQAAINVKPTKMLGDTKIRCGDRTGYVSAIGIQIMKILSNTEEKLNFDGDMVILKRVWDEVLKDNRGNPEAQNLIAVVQAVPELGPMIGNSSSSVPSCSPS